MQLIYAYAQDLKVGQRRHSREELLKAVNLLFQSKARTRRAMVDDQVAGLVAVLKHLIGEDGANLGLIGIDLKNMQLAIRAMPPVCTMAYVELVEILLEARRQRREAGVVQEEAGVGDDILLYVQVLARAGKPLDARTYAMENLRDPRSQQGSECCQSIMKGLIQQGANAAELNATVSLFVPPGTPVRTTFKNDMMVFYATQSDTPQLEQWFHRPVLEGPPQTHKTYMCLIMFALKHEKLEWLDAIFKPILERESFDDATCDALYCWAAAKGKSASEVQHMVDVLASRNRLPTRSRPTTRTINMLLQIAFARNDPYTAERFIDLARRLHLPLDGYTHIEQLRYRVAASDLDGAWHAYNAFLSVSASEVPFFKAKPAVAAFVAAILAAEHPNLDRLESILSECEGRAMRFPAEALRPLALHFLLSNQSLRAIDLFNANLPHLNASDRQLLAESLTTTVLDPATRLRPFWDGYQLLRSHFPSLLSIPARIEIMNACFARQRSDMATLVLLHSNKHPDPDLRPTLPFYAACITGLGRADDAKNLTTVHNLLKLEPRLEADTRVLNALMLAHAGVDEPGRALDFWARIERSDEGPSYASIRILLRAMQAYPFGFRDGSEVWNRLKALGVQLTGECYREYAGVCLTHARWEAFERAVAEMEEEGVRRKREDGKGEAAGGDEDGEGEDRFVVDAKLGQRLYNNAWSADLQVEFTRWISDRYPEVWEEARKTPFQQGVMGLRFEVDNQLEP